MGCVSPVAHVNMRPYDRGGSAGGTAGESERKSERRERKRYGIKEKREGPVGN